MPIVAKPARDRIVASRRPQTALSLGPGRTTHRRPRHGRATLFAPLAPGGIRTPTKGLVDRSGLPVGARVSFGTSTPKRTYCRLGLRTSARPRGIRHRTRAPRRSGSLIPDSPHDSDAGPEKWPHGQNSLAEGSSPRAPAARRWGAGLGQNSQSGASPQIVADCERRRAHAADCLPAATASRLDVDARISSRRRRLRGRSGPYGRGSSVVARPEESQRSEAPPSAAQVRGVHPRLPDSDAVSGEPPAVRGPRLVP
jgi:hypothetical protein